MSSRARFLLLLGLAGASLGCSGDAKKVTPAAFDRPERLALVCYGNDGAPLPLSDCDDIDTEGDADDNDPTVLHGLVTQSARGEVATVDLQGRTVLDSDPRIPGYTFVAVGEIPSAIVVSPDHPEVTYVADFGTRDILAVPTVRFRAEETQATVIDQRLPLPGGPTDMVLAPDGSALFVSLPDPGLLVRVAIEEDGSLGDPETIALSSDVPDLAAAPDDAEYCKTCPGECSDLVAPSTFARDPFSLGDTPRPAALVVDEIDNRLLIADDQLPLIHQFDLSASVLIDDPIAVGSPVADLAITPRVPRAVGDDSEMARFIYAIDALDRSVLVIDDDSRAVLPVSARADTPADRLALGTGAEILEVIATGGADCDVGDVDDAAEAGPARLRGVFVGVGLLDGTLAIIDVHDADATCRGGDLSCENAPHPDEEAVFIRRHRPRIGSTLSSSYVAISTFDLNLGGEPAQLRHMDACPAPLSALPGPFNSDDMTVCGIVDPWAVVDETWTATFEGPLAATSGGRGRLSMDAMDGDAAIFSGEVPFCARGVLGSDDLPSNGPEAEYSGDLLVLTGDPPASTIDSDACAFLDTDPGEPQPRLEFPILHAFEDHLVLADETRPVVDATTGVRVDAVSFETVAACYVELSAYDVRPRAAFVVSSSTSRIRHRVVAASDGACEVDADLPEADVNRASGGAFSNGQIAFDVVVPSEGTNVRFAFRTGQVPRGLRIDVGALPSTILYSPIDGFIYTLDAAGGGLLQIDPTTFSETFAFQ